MKRLDRSARARPAHSRTQPARSAASQAVGEERVLEIEDVGARGDALASAVDGPLYVAYALPGEQVRARVAADRGALIEVMRASADRVAPPCPHFGSCGGCQLQHWAEAPYLAWKQDQVVKALARRNIAVAVEEVISAWGEGRRRAAFHAQRTPRGLKFGYSIRGGGGLVAVTACPILTPGFEAALPRLRRLAQVAAPARGEATLPTLWTPQGLDVDVRGGGDPSGFERGRSETLAALAEELDLARLSFDGEPFLTRRLPVLSMGRSSVSPPPGAFLQPTQQGEEVLGRLVKEALAGAVRVADLFSGVGTFALRLADEAQVHAVEGELAMLEALKRAADAAGGALKAVTIERRDLLRAPLAALELKRFDAVVFDPPRSGARLQAEQIAASRATRVAAVSCDPATFARDAKVLIDAGFSLDRVTPVDQFRWSPHVEIVGAFSR